MSFQAMAWAYAQLPDAGVGVSASTAKLVLIALANYADEDASTFVGVKRLASELGLGERTVRRAIDQLLETRLILERAHRRGKKGTYTTARYVLALHTASGHHDRRPASTSGQDGRPSRHEPAATMTAHEPQASEPQASERERDPAFDALAEETGHNLDGLTRSAARTIGVKLAEIALAEGQARGLHGPAEHDTTLAEEIRVRAHRFRRQHPEWALTPGSLAKHWPTLGATPQHRSLPAWPAPATLPTVSDEDFAAGARAAAEEFRRRRRGHPAEAKVGEG